MPVSVVCICVGDVFQMWVGKEGLLLLIGI